MSSKVIGVRVFSGVFLISGTTIGAGMLGLPLVTGIAGFVPGILMTLSVWLFMYCTGMLFLEVTLWMPDGSNLLSISEKFLGKGGRFFSGVLFIFLYYCLMIAYFTAGAPLFAVAIGVASSSWQSFTIFGSVFMVIVAVGPKCIDRVNIMLSVAMLLAWLILIGEGTSHVHTSHLTHAKWSIMVLATPILFGAFGFHNVIPSLCSYLNRDKRALRIAVFWGSILPLIVYLVWQWLIIGTLPREVIAHTLKSGNEVTSAFRSVTGGRTIILVGRLFAFFAIITSILGVSFSMVDFLGDGFRWVGCRGWKRVWLTSLTFVPPLVLSWLKPNIFVTALGIAGGLGEAVLNGLLPIGLFWLGWYIWRLKSDLSWLKSRGVLIILSLYAVFVILVEVYHLIHHTS